MRLVLLRVGVVSQMVLSACSSISIGPPRTAPPLPSSGIPSSTHQPTASGPIAGTAAEWPFPALPITVFRNIVYANSLLEDGSAWELDVYMPSEGKEWPVILLLHGLGGNKDGYVLPSESIAGSGAVVFTISAPVTTADSAAFENGRGFRETSEVLSCAIGHARSTAVDFGGAPDSLVLVAHSGGVLFGAWTALATDSLTAQWNQYAAEYDGPPAQVECVLGKQPVYVEGFIGIGGGSYLHAERLRERNPDLWEIVSPFSYFGRNLQMPFRLLIGKLDSHGRPASSRAFNEALLEAGYDSQLITYDGGHIMPSMLTFETAVQLVSVEKR